MCVLSFIFINFFSSKEDLSWAFEGCTTAGIGCGECKAKLANNINLKMEIPLETKKKLLEKPKALDEIIQDGCCRAKKVAQETLNKVYKVMSFKPS